MPTQSEILGYDTRQFSSEPSNKPSGAFSVVRDVAANATGALVGLFDKGLEIYGGLAERRRALEAIQDELENETPTVVETPVSKEVVTASVLNLSPKTLMIAAGVGVLAILILRKGK